MPTLESFSADCDTSKEILLADGTISNVSGRDDNIQFTEMPQLPLVAVVVDPDTPLPSIEELQEEGISGASNPVNDMSPGVEGIDRALISEPVILSPGDKMPTVEAADQAGKEELGNILLENPNPPAKGIPRSHKIMKISVEKSPKEASQVYVSPLVVKLKPETSILLSMSENDTTDTNASVTPIPSTDTLSASRVPAVNASSADVSSLEPALVLSTVRNGVRVADRPQLSSRAVSTPILRRKASTIKGQMQGHEYFANQNVQRFHPAPIQTSSKMVGSASKHDEQVTSPLPSSIPLTPLSMPAYLQFELSSSRPPPLYLQNSIPTDFPYESTRVKIDRLLNFLLLPPQLEQVLWFGALACFDAWLYTLTILPLRFVKALYILFGSWIKNSMSEIKFLAGFIAIGLGRMWQRRRAGIDVVQEPATPANNYAHNRRAPLSSPTQPLQHFPFPTQRITHELPHAHPESIRKRSANQRHRRSKSVPSDLLSNEKADILQGFLIILSTIILMNFDASMMYHSIRGQAAIKLYVIYNVLEVYSFLPRCLVYSLTT